MQMIERKKSWSENTCDCTALIGLLPVSIYIYREMMMDTPTPTIHIIVLGSWALRWSLLEYMWVMLYMGNEHANYNSWDGKINNYSQERM